MGKVLMKGNEAIGEAAIRAGCLNYFAYPITPQSEVAEYLSKRLPEAGGNFLQGESEVAVVYMIFGAAACGARVFTTSSSPGISLMSEGLSYITAAQCPAVFVNIMRGGPGLGGILAFPLAEKYRNPVMILGDGLIGQMMEPVEFPDHLKREPSNKDDWATSGMDTRGSARRNLVKTLYLVPEELNAHNLKLKAKYERMAREEIRFEPYNLEGDYRVLIVSYGTMSRVCRTVIDNFRQAGVEIGMVRPQTLFPFPKQAVFDAASKASCRALISVEMSMGQLVEDVDLSVRGIRPVHWYGKCGGEVPTPEEVMEEIRTLL